MKDIKDLLDFNQNNDKLKIERTRNSNGINSVLFKQLYKNIPVFTGEYLVVFDDMKRVISASGNFYPGIEIETTPKIGEQQTIAISKTKFSTSTLNENYISTELIVYPLDEVYKLAWQVNYNDYTTNNFLIIIDANTEEIIYSTDLNPGIDGTAKVYLKDPQSSPTPALVSISNLVGNHYLTGLYVTAYQVGGSQTEGPSNRFLFDPSESGFNEANVYYHINKITDEYFIYKLGYTGSMHISAYVNLDGNGAGMYPLGTDTYKISFMVGNGTNLPLRNDSARKDDIIYHETAHAFLFSKNLSYVLLETQAMHEGYADYFAASYTDEETIGEWYVTDYPYHFRILNTDKNLFNDINYNNLSYYTNTDTYTNGMIWAGALWDLRSALGDATADYIIFRGLEFTDPNAIFEQGLNGILAADSIFFQKAYKSTIISVFYERGIGRPKPPTNLTLTGSIGQNPTLTWNASQVRDLNHYDLYISHDGGSTFNHLIQLAKTVTSYTDPGVTIGDKFDPFIFYKVSATDDFDNESDKSLAVKVHAYGISKDAESLVNSEIPTDFKLFDAYPNPFNPVTTIKFALPEDAGVNITIYDILGNEIAVLADEQLKTGIYTINFDATALSSGVYIYNMAVGNHKSSFNITKKLLLQK